MIFSRDALEYDQMESTDEDFYLDANVGGIYEMHDINTDAEYIEPIRTYDGLPWLDWKERDMVFVNVFGVVIVDIVCCNMDPTGCID